LVSVGAEGEAADGAADRLLRLALTSARVGTWEWDMRSGRIDCSEWVARLFGLSTDKLPLHQDDFVDSVYAPDRERVSAAFDASLRGTDPYEVEYRAQWPDGSLHWLEVKGHLQRDASGSPLRMAGMVSDITARKQAEEKLVSSEALLRQLIAHTPAAVAMFDSEMRYLQASERWLNDYHLAGEAIVGRSHYDVFPDIPERWKETHRRVLAGAIERCDEDPFPRADGSVEWLQWEVRPWRRADDEIAGLIMFTQVITERKRAQLEAARLSHALEERVRELRDSEDHFRSALQHSPIGMAIVAPGGAFLEVNPALCRILGYTREELLARDFQAITHPDDLASDLDNAQQILEGRISEYQLEKRYIHRQGATIWVQLNVSLARNADGTPRHFISQIQDITDRKRVERELRMAESERKRTEAAVRASEARLRRVVGSPILGIAFAGADGILTEANEECLRIIGYTREELASGGVSVRGLTPEDYQAVSAKVLRELKQTGTARPWEMEIVRKDGKRVPVLLGVSSIDDDRSHDVAFVFDLTERRALERQLQHAQRMEAVGRLAAGIAHDFNNVLAAITMSSELLRDELTPEHPGAADVLEIRKAAERAVRLVRQLLAFSRQQVLEPRVLDLNELLSNLHRMLERLAGEQVEIVARLAPGLGAIRADAGQLEQVVVNLAVNARDAMPDGGTLTIETANAYPEAGEDASQGALPSGAQVVLSVSDTGIGMDAQTRARIFEPFFTTKEPGRGTGLGLSTAYGIIRQSGGTIDVASEPGKGTTFRVSLPRVDEAVESIRPPGVPESGGGTETVLVVEDDAAVRQVTRKSLVRLGYRVLDAASPAGAVELVKVYVGAIDLLLTDLVMPGGGGRALARELLRQRPKLRVLYMSGYTDDVAVRQGINDPASAFIQKPFSSAALAHKLRLLLDG
jgi:two-component system cell cycle sensor histidine kinase/response regulator CckA